MSDGSRQATGRLKSRLRATGHEVHLRGLGGEFQSTQVDFVAQPPAATSVASASLALADVLALVERRRAAGARIVFTNGVFDLLHLGHADYLRRARALGDLLVVGLNSDTSTRALKGPQRPLVPEAERAALLASLKSVDAVTIFADATASPLLTQIRPDVYAKGADYATPAGTQSADAPRDYFAPNDELRRLVAGEEPHNPTLAPLAGIASRLSEAAVVAEYGGALALLAYLPNHSTSELIQRIVSRYTPSNQG